MKYLLKNIFIFLLLLLFFIPMLAEEKSEFQLEMESYKKRYKIYKNRSKEDNSALYQINKKKLKKFLQEKKITEEKYQKQMGKYPEFMLYGLSIDNYKFFHLEIAEYHKAQIEEQHEKAIKNKREKEEKEIQKKIKKGDYPTNWFIGNTPEERAVSKYYFNRSGKKAYKKYILNTYWNKLTKPKP